MSINPQHERNQQLRRLYQATKLLLSPETLATIINRRLMKIDNGGLIRGIIETRFITGGISGGFNWEALAPGTQKLRAAQGYGASGPILRRSDSLMNAAVEGELRADANCITLTFKDGPAPRYLGKGKHRHKRTNRIVAGIVDRARAQGETVTGAQSNRLSDYVDRLNAKRPFYGKPTEAELAPLFEARDRIISAALGAIANGTDLFSAIESTE